MSRLIAAAKKKNAFPASCKSIGIGEMSATIPKKSKSSIASEPRRSPIPSDACFRFSALNSTAISGSVVAIPMTVSAAK